MDFLTMIDPRIVRMTEWLGWGLLAWYLACWVTYAKVSTCDGFWQQVWHCLTWRFPPPLPDSENRMTTKDGDWTVEYGTQLCGLCVRYFWVGLYPRSQDDYARWLAMIDQDQTLPPSIRKRHVCFLCLVHRTGRRRAKQRHPAVRHVWPKTMLTHRRLAERFWRDAVKRMLWPFGGESTFKSGWHYLRAPQYKWPMMALRIMFGVWGAGILFTLSLDAMG